MAEIDILLQGLRKDDDHETAVNALLEIKDVEYYLFSLAFARQNGVERISGNLKKVSDKTKIFVGIRNGITSIQSIFALQKIGINPYVVDTATSKKMFHPKIYAAYSDKSAHVILGSANLTFGGLNQNIEASSYLILDREKEKDNAFVNNLIQTLANMPMLYPEHVFQVCSPKQAVLLLQEGRLEDERLINLSFSTSSRVGKQRDTLTPIPTFIKRSSALNKKVKKLKTKLPSKGDKGVLVWESNELTERDLNIPAGDNTHATGSMYFKKGKMDAIDQRRYFRHEVFSDVAWSKDPDLSRKHLERASVNFEIIAKNISYGIHTLKLTHNTKTETKTYQQGNAMTQVHWGGAKFIIAKEDLLGRLLTLYQKDKSNYVIVID